MSPRGHIDKHMSRFLSYLQLMCNRENPFQSTPVSFRSLAEPDIDREAYGIRQIEDRFKCSIRFVAYAMLGP